MADIEPKNYRAILLPGLWVDFEGMPGTTTKKWGEDRVQGFEGRMVVKKGDPPQVAFVPFSRITCWLEVRQEDVSRPQLLVPQGGIIR